LSRNRVSAGGSVARVDAEVMLRSMVPPRRRSAAMVPGAQSTVNTYPDYGQVRWLRVPATVIGREALAAAEYGTR
jgi:hypothetical protein